MRPFSDPQMTGADLLNTTSWFPPSAKICNLWIDCIQKISVCKNLVLQIEKLKIHFLHENNHRSRNESALVAG
jgi:hypothetical protein